MKRKSGHLHFPDTSTFGKYFKRHACMSPKEFKKRSGG